MNSKHYLMIWAVWTALSTLTSMISLRVLLWSAGESSESWPPLKFFEYSLKILLYPYVLDLLTSVIEAISLRGVSQRSKEEIFCFEEEKIFFMVILVLNMWYSSCKRLISSWICYVIFLDFSVVFKQWYNTIITFRMQGQKILQIDF